MKMKIIKTVIFSVLFMLSFSVYASAETHGTPINQNNTIEEQSQQTREQINDLITIVTIGEYDEAEAVNMIDRMDSIHDSLLDGLVTEDISMFFVNFPITELEEFSHLKDAVPRGWENTGSTWDDVPGAGGKPSVARIGYSESGMDHGSLNLELHEIAHPIDTFVLNDISSSSAFQTIHKQEQALFLPDAYFDYPNEYFAEAFAYYFLNDGTRSILKNNAPKTYHFFEMLEDTATKETLNEAIETAYTVTDESSTTELEETLEAAIAINNNPDASSPDIRKAEFTLRQAIINATEQMEERVDQLTTIVTKGEYDRAEAESMIERINQIHSNLLQALIDHEIAVKLINFPITELAEFEHLKGETAANTETAWDEAPGIGEQTVAVRMGHSDAEMEATSLNVELSLIARSIDHIILNQTSSSPEFQEIHTVEQETFLPDPMYEDPADYFAESFAYFFFNDDSNNKLMEQAPRTYDFINSLKITSDKTHLHEVIDQAAGLDEKYHTEGFKRNLTHAMDMSNNPYATQFEVDEAAALLYATLLEMDDTVQEDKEQEESNGEVALGSNIDDSPPPFAETNAFSYLVISLTSIFCGSILLFRTFSLHNPEKMIITKMPFQK